MTYRALIAIALSLLLALPACSGEELKENERQEINRIISTGVGFEDDPFVRAETLRVLELLADPRLDAFARERVEDASPMVQVAALRALMATGNSEVERLALSSYGRGDAATRLAILHAAMEYGPESLRKELFDQALRSKSLKLRKLAFEEGTLAEVNRAVRDKDEQKLKVELIPRLSTLVDSEDFYIAAASLRKLRELGRKDRAEPLLAKFKREDTSVEERVRLARILRVADVAEAKEAFVALAREDDDDDAGELKLPIKRVEPRLVRAATLGAVALGDESFVRPAQEYLKNANEEESIEVLEALARNTSKEATVSIKIAMMDARPTVRHLAIDLYGARADAEAKALINALRLEDQMARRKLANILVARFPDDWSRDLRLQLKAEERKDIVLGLLRDVINSEKDRAILEPLQPQFLEISKEDKVERAATAAYLLLLSAPDNEEYQALLQKQSNVQTRYVFLEHLMRTRPRESAEIFRRYFYDDLFALRLMSAAGLWRAFIQEEDAAAASAGEAAPAGEEAPAEES